MASDAAGDLIMFRTTWPGTRWSNTVMRATADDSGNVLLKDVDKF